jgi:hypothetical protein
MENNHIDAFIEYLLVIEENANQLTGDQVKKLELIRAKVHELVRKVEPVNLPIATAIQPIMAESPVVRFSEYHELNEMIKKRGSKWVVTDKSGKKVLGTHPSREKALKQLRAIEISKMRG